MTLDDFLNHIKAGGVLNTPEIYLCSPICVSIEFQKKIYFHSGSSCQSTEKPIAWMSAIGYLANRLLKREANVFFGLTV